MAEFTTQIYRKSAIGSSLLDALDEMTERRQIPPDLAATVLQHYDKAATRQLQKAVSQDATIKGKLHTYNLIDGIWQFVVKDATMGVNEETVHVDAVKIIAVETEAKRNEAQKGDKGKGRKK